MAATPEYSQGNVDGFAALGAIGPGDVREVGAGYLVAGLPGVTVRQDDLKRLWARLRRTVGDPALALRIGQHYRPPMQIVHCLAFWSATLGEALQRIARYWPLAAKCASECTLVEDPQGARWRYHVLERRFNRRDWIAYRMVTWQRLCAALVGYDLTPVEVRFAFSAPPHRHEFGRIFGAPAVFRAAHHELVLSPAALGLPVVERNPDLLRHAVAIAEELLLRHQRGTAVAEHLRGFLRAHLAEGQVGIKHVAPRLGMSVRTLQRRLLDEGLTYHQVLDGVRRQRCLEHLGNDGLTFVEIAGRLGYSRLASFHRAFRRWFGRTPAQFRRGD